MDHFFDEAARVLASEMPRRQALKRLGALIGGSILATLGVSAAQAQVACGGGGLICSGKKSQCCLTGTTPFCVTTGKLCCGSTSCKSGQFCCDKGTKPFCRTAKSICCGNNKCKSSEVCCGGTTCCKSCTTSGKCAGTAGPNP